MFGTMKSASVVDPACTFEWETNTNSVPMMVRMPTEATTLVTAINSANYLRPIAGIFINRDVGPVTISLYDLGTQSDGGGAYPLPPSYTVTTTDPLFVDFQGVPMIGGIKWIASGSVDAWLKVIR